MSDADGKGTDLHHEVADDVGNNSTENFPLQKFFFFRKIGCLENWRQHKLT